MILISGSSNPALTKEISALSGAEIADVEISKFPNGEKRVWIKDDLEGKHVAIVQSFSEPVDEHIIELCLLSDAARHLNASKITAVIPWLGYSPQDKSFRKGEPVSVHVIAKIIESIGIENIVTVDIHSDESLEHFHIPVTHTSALSLFIEYFKEKNLTDYSVVSVDKGALETSTKMSQVLNLPLIVFDKTRDRATGEIALIHKSGQVEGKHIIAIDDFVSTGSTRISACEILKNMGALSYTDCITHALLAADSPQKLQNSSIDQIITTNTYHIPETKKFEKLNTISIAPVLSEALIKIDAQKDC